MAVVTDKLRLTNCSNFVNDVANGGYYIFIGFPNATAIYPNWDSTRPDPIDDFLYLNSYRDNILGIKKITSSDLIRVIPKIVWTSGKKYDMYRHDYSVYNTTPVSSSARLYDSSYYVMNSEYRVYICINNNSLPSNSNTGTVSTQEPLHTDQSPRLESDGYMWKYLYTISPADVLKFDSTNYISVPSNWETTANSEIARIRDNAVSGRIETVLVENNSAQYILPTSTTIVSNVPIKGDGTSSDGTGNAKASIEFDEQGRPSKVTVTDFGKNYTFGTLDLDSILNSQDGSKAIFNVIIPPSGGHGANIYNELGAFRTLVYSRIENDSTNPDFIVGNQFSRIGIIKDVTVNGGTTAFSSNTGSGVYAIKINEDASAEVYDSVMTQSNTGAIGNLISYDTTTKIVKYIQPRFNNIDTYVDGLSNIQIDYNYADSITGIQTTSNYKLSNFDSSTFKIGNNSYTVDTSLTNNANTFVSNLGITYYLGQTFNGGVSSPDINTKSGDILYVDNRASVTRSSQQREDIKIILEF
jgi:hypothetical protein